MHPQLPSPACALPCAAALHLPYPDDKQPAPPPRGGAADSPEHLASVQLKLQVHFPNVLAKVIAQYAAPDIPSEGESAARTARELFKFGKAAVDARTPHSPRARQLAALHGDLEAGLRMIEGGFRALRWGQDAAEARLAMTHGFEKAEKASAPIIDIVPGLELWVEVLRHEARKAFADFPVILGLTWPEMVRGLLESAREAGVRGGVFLSIANPLNALWTVAETLKSEDADKLLAAALRQQMRAVRPFNASGATFSFPAWDGATVADVANILWRGWEQPGCREAWAICREWQAHATRVHGYMRIEDPFVTAIQAITTRLAEVCDLAAERMASEANTARLGGALTSLRHAMVLESIVNESHREAFTTLEQALGNVADDSVGELVSQLRVAESCVHELALVASAGDAPRSKRPRESKED